MGKETKKIYQQWWFWLCIVIIIIVLCFISFHYIDKFQTSFIPKNTKNEYIDILLWEDLYRLEEKDVNKKVFCIATVNNIINETFYKEGNYYSTYIELMLYDKDFQQHYFRVSYNRPYESEKLLEKDVIAFYGIFKNKAGQKIEITQIDEIQK